MRLAKLMRFLFEHRVDSSWGMQDGAKPMIFHMKSSKFEKFQEVKLQELVSYFILFYCFFLFWFFCFLRYLCLFLRVFQGLRFSFYFYFILFDFYFFIFLLFSLKKYQKVMYHVV